MQTNEDIEHYEDKLKDLLKNKELYEIEENTYMPEIEDDENLGDYDLSKYDEEPDDYPDDYDDFNDED